MMVRFNHYHHSSAIQIRISNSQHSKYMCVSTDNINVLTTNDQSNGNDPNREVTAINTPIITTITINDGDLQPLSPFFNHPNTMSYKVTSPPSYLYIYLYSPDPQETIQLSFTYTIVSKPKHLTK